MLKTTKLLSALVFLVATLLFTACTDNSVQPGAANDVSSSIPSDASAVVLVDVKNLMEKADYSNFQKQEVFTDFLKKVEKQKPELVPFIKDPSNTGIDITGNMGFYCKVTTDLETSDFAVILPVADVAKVKTTITEFLKDKKEVKPVDKEGYTIYTVEEKMHIVQSEKILAFASFEDDAKIKPLVAPEGKGIRDNKRYKAQAPTGKDITFWIDFDPIMEAVLSNPKTKLRIEGALASAGIPIEGLKNNSCYGYQDFLQGKTEGVLDFSFSDELNAELGDLVADKMTIDYTKYFPNENLGAAFSFGVNEKGILNFLTKRGLDKQINKQLGLLGLDLAAFEAGITGDMAIGAYPPADNSSEPSVIAVLGLKEKAFMEGIMSKPPFTMFMPKDGENYVFSRGTDMMGNEMPKVYARITDDALVISNNSTLFENGLAGKGNTALQPLQDGWMGAYIDYTALNENMDVIANLSPLSPAEIATVAKSMQHQSIETAYFTTKGTLSKQHSTLKDKNTNSLKSILMSWNEIYKSSTLDNSKEQEAPEEAEEI